MILKTISVFIYKNKMNPKIFDFVVEIIATIVFLSLFLLKYL